MAPCGRTRCSCPITRIGFRFRGRHTGSGDAILNYPRVGSGDAILNYPRVELNRFAVGKNELPLEL